MSEKYTIADIAQEPVKVWDLPQTDEAEAFEAGFRFYENRQHDHCDMLWDGRTNRDHPCYIRQRYLPIDLPPADPGRPEARKPDMPTPTAAVIVQRNTGVLLASDTEINVPVDEDTQELLRAIYKAGDLRLGYAQARNMAGGGGNAIVIPCIVGGKVQLLTHRPSQFRVMKWSDTEPWQPERIVRQVMTQRLAVDQNGKRSMQKFWESVEWDQTNVTTYQPVHESWERDKAIPVAVNKDGKPAIKPHGCVERCPVTWYKNTPSDTPWGTTDFAGLEPRCDAIDRLGSHVHGAVGKNCDPTIVHSDDESTRKRNPIYERGRGVVYKTSEKGQVVPFEIAGNSINIAREFWRELQSDTYELADVVRVTAELAGTLKSGEAQRMLWRASEVRVGWLWPQLAGTIRRTLECYYAMAETFGVSSFEAPKKDTILLPSRVVKKPPPPVPAPPALAPVPVEGEAPAGPPALPPPPPREAKPTEELVEHKVGKFGYIGLVPGPYFERTAAEKQSELGALGGACGGKPVLSHETAVEEAARTLGLDPDEELRRLAQEEHVDAQRMVDQANAVSAAALMAAGEGDDEEEASDAPAEPDEDAAAA